MITATLFMVASSEIIRKQDLFLGVDVAAVIGLPLCLSKETSFLVARRATMAASDPFIGLENESMIVHSVNYEICMVQFVQFQQFA